MAAPGVCQALSDVLCLLNGHNLHRCCHAPTGLWEAVVQRGCVTSPGSHRIKWWGWNLSPGGKHLRALTTFNDVVSIYSLVRSMCHKVLKYLFFLFQSTVQRTSYVCSQMFVYKLNDFSPNLAVNPLDNRSVHPWASGLSADPRGPQPARGNRAPPNPNCSWDVPSSVNTGILFLGDKKGPIQLIKTCSFSNFPAIL